MSRASSTQKTSKTVYTYHIYQPDGLSDCIYDLSSGVSVSPLLDCKLQYGALNLFTCVPLSLAQGLSQSRCWVNVRWMNEWMNEGRMNKFQSSDHPPGIREHYSCKRWIYFPTASWNMVPTLVGRHHPFSCPDPWFSQTTCGMCDILPLKRPISADLEVYGDLFELEGEAVSFRFPGSWHAQFQGWKIPFAYVSESLKVFLGNLNQMQL